MTNSASYLLRSLMLLSSFAWVGSSPAEADGVATRVTENFSFGYCSHHAPSYSVSVNESQLTWQSLSFYQRTQTTLTLDLITGNLHSEFVADKALDETPAVQDLAPTDAEYKAKVLLIKDVLANVVKGEACYSPRPEAQKYVDVVSKLIAE